MAPASPVRGRADRWRAVGRAGSGAVTAPGCHGRTAQHRLDLQRRHEPASRGLRRRRGPAPDARSLRRAVDPLHACVQHRAGLRAEPGGHHHGHVSGGDRRAAHAHDRGSGAGAAGSISRGAAVLRQGIPRVPARGGLLHQQPREDRLSVRRAVHDLGRPRGSGPLEEPPRSRTAVLRRVQPRGHARESELPDQPGAQGETGRDQSGRDQSAAVLPGQPDGPRRAGAHVRQHRRHGRTGCGTAPAAR